VVFSKETDCEKRSEGQRESCLDRLQLLQAGMKVHLYLKRLLPATRTQRKAVAESQTKNDGAAGTAVGMNFPHFFIDRPNLRRGDQHRHHAGRCDCAFNAAHRAISRYRATNHPGHSQLSGRERESCNGNRCDADRAASQWRREHALHVLAKHE